MIPRSSRFAGTYLLCVAAAALAVSVMARQLDLMWVVLAALGFAVRQSKIPRPTARWILGLGIVLALLPLAVTALAYGNPVRVAIFGRLVISETPWLPAAALGATLIVSLLVPWLALAPPAQPGTQA